MTILLRARLAKAESNVSDARDSIYEFAAPRNDVPFNQCLQLASQGAVICLRAAQDALRAVENEAIEKRKAWRDERHGAFHWY